MDLTSKYDKFKKIKSIVENHRDASKIDDSVGFCDRKYVNEAINFLSRKSLSEKELKYKLKRKFGDFDFDPVIHRLKRLNFLNDNELAQSELKKMSERKFYSNSKIKSHMNFKGLEPESLEFPENEKERALNLLKKKYKTKSEKNKNRACRLLFSYGYSSNIVRECIDEYFR